jgi:energy-coupling factor transporter transmembrane protein EcfT
MASPWKNLRNNLEVRILLCTFVVVMNWKFILSWAIKFALSTVVFDIALAWTESAWLAFPMALGFLIIIAILESYAIDWIGKWKEKHNK